MAMPTRENSAAKANAQPTAESTVMPTYTLWSLAGYFVKLGTLGFGGPVALVGYMNRDLVERRHWILEADYKEGLTLAQLAPGPLAAQLAIYLGFVHYRVVGATIAGLAFVLPSFLMVVALGWSYVHYEGLPWMQSVFYGIGASVIGIIIHSAYKLTVKTVGKRLLLWVIYLVSASWTVVTETENVWLFLTAGIITWMVKAPPRFLRGSRVRSLLASLPLGAAIPLASQSEPQLLWRMLLFFAKAGAFVFGSGLAIVPFLRSGVVKEFHWLDDQQFLDAVAVAMITPGPVVITVGFIGYLVAGIAGACVAALGVFLPCYFFTVIPAPYFSRYGKRPALIAFVDGVTAAAIGAITGAVIILGRQTLWNAGGELQILKVVLLAATLACVWSKRKIPEPLIILSAAIFGLIVSSLHLARG